MSDLFERLTIIILH